MQQLKPHQQFIVNEDRAMAPIALGTGAGKTVVALSLARYNTLVIMPKQQKLDETWEKNAKKFGIDINLTTISKETFRRDWQKLPRYNTLIVDESHTILGMSPTYVSRKGVKYPKTSQLFDAVDGYIKLHKPARLYFCSGTPIPHPMNLYALAKLMGINWNFEKFRERFYVERKMGFRSIWIEKKDQKSKELLVTLFKETLGAFTGQLSDWFDVPDQEHKTVFLELTKEQRQAIAEVKEQEADPMVARAKIRCIENGILYTTDVVDINEKESRMVRKAVHYTSEKLDAIQSLATEHDKIIIFANYTAQIEAIERALLKDKHTVFTLTGATKDRGEVIQKVEDSLKAILVVQSSISAGWEIPSCRCVVFASKGWRFVDYNQALGRNLRLNNIDIANNTYYHLVVKGGPDYDCHKSILMGEDFHEMIMSNE